MAFVKVCSLDDVWEGDMESFDVGDKEVLVVHLEGGDVVATQAICPHQQVELVEGELSGKTLTCRSHLWMFDLTTCTGINPGHAELARYPVRLDGDDVYIDPDGDTPKVAHS
ncbi:Rieske 2Fe-2S domain-containing protein [Pseudonocardia broussonetiae]|uniref:Rieske 2Fe-2S domain-containing protein n=1 Tax=Pseudonocardia broussonetiae TaxID=2736640 RepID=A0A6M6JN21_9PSEU|nr:Rieske 2Fe-2S domain-containing protein [Pseudonocardia broussonetiae]QJY49358.1 Rieske 2Fe-2S domain-containing protein [Pseudonocardia broussonetiae]